MVSVSGIHEGSGLEISQLDPAVGIELIESGRLSCMVHLDEAFQLVEMAKFQKQAEKDCHLVCAKEHGSDEPCGFMLYRRHCP
jgi:hypothetical protein